MKEGDAMDRSDEASRPRRFSMLLALTLVLGLCAILTAASAAAAATSTQAGAAAIADRLYDKLQLQDEAGAQSAAKELKKWWSGHKAGVKSESLDLALEIDRQIAALSLALLGNEAEKAADAASSLRFSLHAYEDGAYAQGSSGMTLSRYSTQLLEAKALADRQQWAEASRLVKRLQQEWLSVEGDVVGKSAAVYHDAERDLVLADAYLTNEKQRPLASEVLGRMAQSLAPLADAGFTWLDAALIPFREGMEAVLVIGALGIAADRSSARRPKRWIAAGTAVGLLVSIGAAAAIAIWLTSAVAGTSSMLLNGWTGLLSSVMLLYVSYWLHRQADIRRRGARLRTRADRTSSAGSGIGFAALAFLAVAREGVETAIFLIGLAGKLSLPMLLAGLAAGLAMLAAVAGAIKLAGTRLPLRPLFLVSSAVVFYLCFKFLGSGIHSLQMAGMLPLASDSRLPELASISLYPSWTSTWPQLALVIAALVALALRPLRRARSTAKQMLS
ncbi:iron permease FTR1 family protein [Paenibacillus sp. B01]|nr:iron permease FTR1 family protein [Paenibacillus sp. B01]